MLNSVFLMLSQEVVVKNKLGVHARPAAQFVKTSSQFQSEIRVEKDEEEVDGKSIMGLMMLAAGYESVLTISADGSDEGEAIKTLVQLVEGNFEDS